MRRILNLRQAPPGRISLAGITPDRLAPLTANEIERLPLILGKQTFALGDFFAVSGDADLALAFEGFDPRFSDACAGMTAGECHIEGDAGDFAGRDMRGGRLVINGSVGRFAASGLAGGELLVSGNAGDCLGAALPWLAGGMRGGRVVVRGNAGARCGDKLRRGEIFVEGDAGDFCASRMVAGSVIVAGRIGAHAGYAMRRGSLLVLNAPFAAPPTFAETVMCADGYLNLVWRDWLARFEKASPFAVFASRAVVNGTTPRRWMGDVAADGRGEVFGFAT
jgi:formylmethanofuran dehydrogenase subunit C